MSESGGCAPWPHWSCALVLCALTTLVQCPLVLSTLVVCMLLTFLKNKLCTKCTLCTKCALSTKFRLCPLYPSPSDHCTITYSPHSVHPADQMFCFLLDRPSHLPRCSRFIALTSSFTRLSYVRCQFSLHHTWTKFWQGTKPSKCLTCLRIWNVEQTNKTKFSSVFYWLLRLAWLIAAWLPSILILLSQTWFHKSSIVCERILTRGSTATRTRGE